MHNAHDNHAEHADTTTKALSSAFRIAAKTNPKRSIFAHIDITPAEGMKLMQLRLAMLISALAIEAGTPRIIVDMSALALIMGSRTDRVVEFAYDLGRMPQGRTGMPFLVVDNVCGHIAFVTVNRTQSTAAASHVDIGALVLLKSSRSLSLAINLARRGAFNSEIADQSITDLSQLIGLQSGMSNGFIMQELKKAVAEIMKAKRLGVRELEIMKTGSGKFSLIVDQVSAAVAV